MSHSKRCRTEWGRTVEAAHWLGHRYLIVPWLPETERRTLDQYRRLAAELSELGARARETGLRLGYHNHDFEFVALEGSRPFDLLLRDTDPATVTFEMDLFWVVNGGGDPIDYFSRFPGRFELVHVKDRGPGGEMADVGRGAINFARIFSHPDAAAIQHFFVEHDSPAAPFSSIRFSFETLKRLRNRPLSSEFR